ncbi:hypothetical protein E8E13_009781 [Curvularia kusanoi]|uniref:Uncharacterized protein n=1 Tax=Curvularia kusanoi TaxID=90978 RepID=A0A9P4TDS5_CURKU|nr:hypothetical protein E8E13_009781 [Curvularia kusanoi]
MVSQSLALFRPNRSKDLHDIAQEHLEHDLELKDREVLNRAGRKLTTHVGLGSLVGIGLGLYGAYKLRTMRVAYFNAFKAMEKPTEIRFADGRTEKIPDLTDKLAPSKWGDAATFFLFSVGGLMLGGEVGLLTGSASASRTLMKDPASRDRIEKAIKNYRIDVLKREIEETRRAKLPTIL